MKQHFKIKMDLPQGTFSPNRALARLFLVDIDLFHDRRVDISFSTTSPEDTDVTHNKGLDYIPIIPNTGRDFITIGIHGCRMQL